MACFLSFVERIQLKILHDIVKCVLHVQRFKQYLVSETSRKNCIQDKLKFWEIS